MQGNTLNLHTPLTSGPDRFKGQILKLCSCKYTLIKLSTKTYLTGVCYDLNDTEGELRITAVGPQPWTNRFTSASTTIVSSSSQSHMVDPDWIQIFNRKSKATPTLCKEKGHCIHNVSLLRK